MIWLLIALIAKQEHFGSPRPAAPTQPTWETKQQQQLSFMANGEGRNRRNPGLLITWLTLSLPQSVSDFSHHVPVTCSLWPNLALSPLALPVHMPLPLWNQAPHPSKETLESPSGVGNCSWPGATLHPIKHGDSAAPTPSPTPPGGLKARL